MQQALLGAYEMVSVTSGGEGRNDVGIADNAAGKRTIDGEDIQAESSESSSGHSDKDWIRYSKFRCMQIKVPLCGPDSYMCLCGPSQVTMHNDYKSW